ncbi:helix-turn-helix transcriptional regulator [Mycetocola reblochoni]|uniref:Regulatory protein, LuxR n=2 Tax=Mycetocola reblochoni TaxID=331618 RepID=A0A1R4K5D9_9MICO|nr:helix-turn-helix transcriptional regulator [Mycetocola reblochoni]RLP69864.1 LuxR family transcriptional regulator [Mycetocola reblochoni]SJN39233.1 regulatory protein, LuxR [Mycetocola reblochoni REB411]
MPPIPPTGTAPDLGGDLTSLRSALHDDDHHAVAALLRTGFWPLLAADGETTVRALNALPPELISADPELTAVAALCVLLTPQEAIAPSGVGTGERSAPPGRAHRVADVFDKMLRHRLHGDFADADAAAHLIRSILAQGRRPGDEVSPSLQSLALLHCGVTAILMSHSSTAVADFEAARQIAIAIGNTILTREATAKLALVHALRGNEGVTRASLAACAAMPEPTPIMRAVMHDAENMARDLMAVERDPVVGLPDTGFAMAMDTLNELWPIRFIIETRRALARLSPGTVAEWARLLRTSRATAMSPLAIDALDAGCIDAAVCSGEYGAARRIAEQSTHQGRLTAIARLRLAVVSGGARRAEQEVAHIRHDPDLPLTTREELSLLRAWIAVELGHVPDRADALAAVLVHGRRPRMFTLVPSRVLSALAPSVSVPLRDAYVAACDGVVSVVPDTAVVRLSPRELAVAHSIVTDRTVPESALRLSVSVNTVKTQLKSVYRKLGVTTRAEARDLIRRLGIVDDPGQH